MALLLVNNIECWELSVIGQVAMIQSYYWQEPQFATLPVPVGNQGDEADILEALSEHFCGGIRH